ncbi:MAG: phospholipase [Paludibacteraceae bacterium]|nr:phospholipase [Paludibacteraceae bacterium]
MIPLLLFIILGVLVLVATEIHERRKQPVSSDKTGEGAGAQKPYVRPEGCCGEHLVCERETLLQTSPVPEYYDDEELDSLAGISPENYTDEQEEAVRAVFSSLQESDVPGWCRSLQLRNISLPADVREEALMIVRELRSQNHA